MRIFILAGRTIMSVSGPANTVSFIPATLQLTWYIEYYADFRWINLSSKPPAWNQEDSITKKEMIKEHKKPARVIEMPVYEFPAW